MIIPAVNNLAEKAQKTYLSNPEVAGTTTIRVKNTTGLTAGWAIQLGETGEQFTEVILGTASNIGTVANTALSFPHPADTPVYFTKFDKVVFEKSATGTTGVATPLSSGTIGYQPDQIYTQFDDTTGTTTDAYKTYFRNSALAVNSTESAWITPAGFSFYSLGKLRQRIRAKLWNSSFIVDDDINDWVNEWKEKMRNAAIAVNEDYALGTVSVAFGTAGLGTITSSDFNGQIRRMWVTYDGQNYNPASKMMITEFRPNQAFFSTSPSFAMQGESVFQVKPDGAAGTAQIAYFSLNSPLTADTDEIPLPMHGYTKSFTDYAQAQALYKDGKPAEGKAKEESAYNELNAFRFEISPRNKTNVTMIEQVEPTDNGDGYYF